MPRKKTTNVQSEGVGDTIQKVLKATGIEKVAKFILGEDCGCDERRKKWNERWRYHVPKCLTEEHYDYLSEWFKRNPTKVKPAELEKLLEIYNYVYHYKKREMTTCSSCVSEMIAELYLIFKDYGDDN